MRLFFFALTLLCVYFIFTYPAVRLFFFALTLLSPYFIFTYPAVRLFFCALLKMLELAIHSKDAINRMCEEYSALEPLKLSPNE